MLVFVLMWSGLVMLGMILEFFFLGIWCVFMFVVIFFFFWGLFGCYSDWLSSVGLGI